MSSTGAWGLGALLLLGATTGCKGADEGETQGGRAGDGRTGELPAAAGEYSLPALYAPLFKNGRRFRYHKRTTQRVATHSPSHDRDNYSETTQLDVLLCTVDQVQELPGATASRLMCRVEHRGEARTTWEEVPAPDEQPVERFRTAGETDLELTGTYLATGRGLSRREASPSLPKQLAALEALEELGDWGVFSAHPAAVSERDEQGSRVSAEVSPGEWCFERTQLGETERSLKHCFDSASGLSRAQSVVANAGGRRTVTYELAR